MLLRSLVFRREIDEIPGVRPHLSGEAYLGSRQKRLVDVYGAWALRCAAGPAMQLARLAVLAEDGGPTIVGLPRIGKGGVEFRQYKIRTMAPGTERETETVRVKDSNDHRITQVGQRLRTWSVDELPQLRNVREGTMSLVGPRPKSLAEFEAYGQVDEEYQSAYIVSPPGMTGLEQIGGRAEADIEKRIELTKRYAAEASLALDADILVRTIGAVANKEGAY